MDSELTLYGFRALACIQVLIVFAAAACAAVVAGKARGNGIKPIGPGLLAGSLVVSGLNGIFFSIIDWLEVDTDVFYPLAIAAMGLEVLIAAAFIAGLALTGRLKPEAPA